MIMHIKTRKRKENGYHGYLEENLIYHNGISDS